MYLCFLKGGAIHNQNIRIASKGKKRAFSRYCACVLVSSHSNRSCRCSIVVKTHACFYVVRIGSRNLVSLLKIKRGVMTLSTTTTTMLASNVTTTTPTFLPPSLATTKNHNHNTNSMEQYDRRPTPMEISSLPTKSMATVSSSSSTTSSSTVSSMTSSPFPTPFHSKPTKDGGLHHLSKAKIDEFLQPMLQSLIELDAEALLQLQRVSQGGAQVSDGYVDEGASLFVRSSTAVTHVASTLTHSLLLLLFCRLLFHVTCIQSTCSTHSYQSTSFSTSRLCSISSHCRSAGSI